MKVAALHLPSKFLRAGPVNWTPRFDAVPLDAAGYRDFLRYVENNPVRAKLVKKAVNWEWSSAAAHCAGVNAGGRLCLDQWQHLFGNPATVTAAWREYLEGPAEEVRRNTARLAAQIPYNRPLGWLVPRRLPRPADPRPWQFALRCPLRSLHPATIFCLNRCFPSRLAPACSTLPSVVF